MRQDRHQTLIAVVIGLALTVPADGWAASSAGRSSASSASRTATPSAVSKPASVTPKSTSVSPKASAKPVTKPVTKPVKKLSPAKQTPALTTGKTASPSSDPRSRTQKFTTELEKNRKNYDTQILKGQPDPYKMLMADSEKKAIAGPSGSNLAAMVKVRSSVGTDYRRVANQELANNVALQRELSARFSRESGSLQGQFVPPEKKKGSQYGKPYLLRPDGSKVELEWHRSPNHPATAVLIPKEEGKFYTRFDGLASKNELEKTRVNYSTQVLKGQPDPYKALTADPDKKIIAGPPGSNLVAMVKVRPSVGKDYRDAANQELANNAALQRELTARFAREQGDMRGQLVPPQKNGKSYQRPYLLRPDGSKVELEWHHSPNHVGTVSLIPVTTHRLGEGGMKRLHYVDPQTHKAQGGDKLYTIPRPPDQPAAEQP